MLLLISALDPTGLSGLARDTATAADLGQGAATLCTAWVSENTHRVESVDWREPAALRRDLSLVLEEHAADLKAVKIGVISPPQLVALWPLLKKTKLPVVLDPVLTASSGGAFAPNPADLLPLMAQLTLTTPNRAEAAALLGKKTVTPTQAAALGKSVLVKSAHQTRTEIQDWLLHNGEQHVLASAPLAGEHRGTGCTLATAIAVGLAQNMPLPQAVAQGRDYLREARELAQGRRLGPVNAPRAEVLAQLTAVIPRLEQLPSATTLAEVGLNLAFCLPGAQGPQHAAAFAGRAISRHGLLFVPGYPAFGVSSHVARVAVQAHQLFPQIRAAVNVRHSGAMVAMLKQSGLAVASFDRAREPKNTRHLDHRTLDWGVRAACAGRKSPPDAVVDGGGPGKEPMIRLLAQHPGELMDKLTRLLGLESVLG